MRRLNRTPLTALAIIGLYLIFFIHNSDWNHHVSGGGDSWGYYAYLPALFIQQDLKTLDKTLAVRQSMYPNNVMVVNDTLRVDEAPAFGQANVLKYTCGVAVLNLAPFAVAHVYTLLTDPDLATGFTQPYRFALYLNALFFIFIGLWLIWKVIAPRYGKTNALLTVATIGLATNLFYFGVLNNVMAHPFLFTLWAGLIFCTDRFYRDPRRKWAILIGLATGMITLIRPTECISLLIPLLWDLKSFRQRLQFIRDHRRLFIWIGFSFALCAIPQLMYWKYVTGDWIYYSYTNEGFRFNSPRILEGFFSFRNGWLIYSPVMVLSVLGIISLFKRRDALRFMVLAVLLLHAYLAFSWWNWYYINGFGMRAMVELYPLMALPLAALLLRANRVWKWIFSVFILICIALNLFQTTQHRNGIMWTQSMNAAYYRQAFGKTKMDQKMSTAFDLHTYQRDDRIQKSILMTEDFEQSDHTLVSSAYVKNGSRAYRIIPDAAEDFGFHEYPFEETEYKPGDLLSISCWIYVEKQISQYYDMASFDIAVLRDEKIYDRRYLRLNNKPGEPGNISIWWGVPRTWHHLQAHYRIPRKFKPGDTLRVSLLSPNSRSVVYIDDLEIAMVR